MSLNISPLAQKLEQGSYYQVFSELANFCKESSSINSSEADNLISKLLPDPFFNTSVPKRELEETISLLDNKGLVLKSLQTSIVGFAQFPVVSPDKKDVWLLEFEAVASDKIQTPGRITPKAGNDLLSQLLLIQFIIQSSLSIEELGGNDTTILNYGLKLEIRPSLIPAQTRQKSISQNSIQFAAVVAYFSGFSKIPVDAGFVFTGAFDKRGNSMQVGDTKLKIEKIFEKRPGVKQIFIPKSDFYSSGERQLITENADRIVEIRDLRDLIQKVFGSAPKTLLQLPKSQLHELGSARIITTLLGKRTIGIQHFDHEEYPPIIEKEYDTIYAGFSEGEINVPNINEIYTTLGPAKKQLILLSGIIPLFWLGAYIHGSKNFARLIAVKYKRTDNYIIVASDEGDKELIGKQFRFKYEEEKNR